METINDACIWVSGRVYLSKQALVHYRHVLPPWRNGIQWMILTYSISYIPNVINAGPALQGLKNGHRRKCLTNISFCKRNKPEVVFVPGMDAPARGEGGVPRPAPRCGGGGGRGGFPFFFANRASNFVPENLSTYEIAPPCPKYHPWCCWVN